MLDDHVLTSSNKEQYSTRKVKSPYRDSETPKSLPFGYGQENNGRDEKYNQIKLQYDKSLKHSYIQVENEYPQYQRQQAPEFGGRFEENRTPVERRPGQGRPQSQFDGRRTSDQEFEGRQEQRNLERTFGMRDKQESSQRNMEPGFEQRQFEGRPNAYGENPYKPMMREDRRQGLVENEGRPHNTSQPAFDRREARPIQGFERTLQGRQGPEIDRFERTLGRGENEHNNRQPHERKLEFEARPNIQRPDMNPVGFEPRGPYDRKPVDDRPKFEGRSGFDQRPRMDERLERPGLERPGIERPGLERPGFDRPGFERPGLERPGLERPGLERTAFERPGFERPGLERAGFERPGERQGLERVGLERQVLERPQYERSMPERQGLERVGLDRTVRRPEDRFEGRYEGKMEERRLFDERQLNERRPEFDRSGIGRPEIGRAEMGRPEMGRPDLGRPDYQRSEQGGRPEYQRAIPYQRPELGRPEYRQPDSRPEERIQRRQFDGRPQSEARFDGRDLRTDQREPLARMPVDPRYIDRSPFERNEQDRRPLPDRPRQFVPDIRSDIHAQRLEQELARRGNAQRTDYGRQETISYLGRSDIRNRPLDQESKSSLGLKHEIRPRTDLDRRMGELEQRQGLLKSSYDRIANREPIANKDIKPERSSQYEFSQRTDLQYQKYDPNQKTTFQRPPLQDRPGFERFNRSYIGFDGKERSVIDRLGLDRSREMENHRFPTEHIGRPQLDLKQFGQTNYRETFENKGYQRTAYIPESRTPTYPRSDYRRGIIKCISYR